MLEESAASRIRGFGCGREGGAASDRRGLFYIILNRVLGVSFPLFALVSSDCGPRGKDWFVRCEYELDRQQLARLRDCEGYSMS